MSYTFEHDGLTREFNFYAPVAWQYWVGEAFKQGRTGLPVVIALHGGGEDPNGFITSWPFPEVWEPTAGEEYDLEDQFFVIYPKATAKYDTPDGPVRSWNTGLNGDSTGTAVDEISFIQEVLDRVERMLMASQITELTDTFSLASLFDVDRRFVFGYSEGGMLAYQLANAMPDQWAALWVMSGAIGGRLHAGFSEFPIVINGPTGTHSVSVFHHHGSLDTIIPPDPTHPYRFPGLCLSSTGIDLIKMATGLKTEDAEGLAPGLLPQSVAIQTVRDYLGLGPVGTLTDEPSLSPPRILHLPSLPELGGPGFPISPSEIVISVHSAQTVYPPSELNAENPQVVKYRDPGMAHTGFATDPRRYFFVRDVWEFFRTHPRRRLIKAGVGP